MRALLSGLVLAAALGGGGCATVGQPSASDPLQGINRATQAFNDTVDDALLKPLAESWVQILPAPVRRGVSNFFGNLGDGWSAVNHLLQGKPEPALNMTLRMAVNTTFGLGGVLDVASEAGLERQSEDLGQTLGVWGVPPGPYLVLPFFGPSTLRDVTDTAVTLAYDTSLQYTENHDLARGGFLINVINIRANLLGATRLLDDIALDRYSFLRDAYLARRLNLVYNGNPPEERFDDAK
jgi:phospholipid-binding lipoprotein MlaA